MTSRRSTGDSPGSTGPADPTSPTAARGQSNVVGVALLLGVTVLALGALTAGIGATIGDSAASADAARVADTLDGGLRPVETTGANRVRVDAAGGHLYTAARDLRVIDGDGVRTVPVGALVYERGDRRVTFLAGAIARGEGGNSRLVRPPPITASRGRGGVLVVGAPRLNASGREAVSGEKRLRATLRTDVRHERTDLGRGEYRVAVETEATRAWVRAFERRNATVLATDREYDGDGTTSVVARFPGERTAYLVVHDMRLEVT